MLIFINRTTTHKTEARFISGLGWGLKRRIEEYSANKFKTNIEKVRFIYYLLLSYILTIPSHDLVWRSLFDCFVKQDFNLFHHRLEIAWFKKVADGVGAIYKLQP